MTKNLSTDQERQVTNLRRWARDLANGVVCHPENVKAFLAEAVELIDVLLDEGTEIGQWYFLRDESSNHGPAWWIYSPKWDAWRCFYGDRNDPDAAETITDIVAGKRPSSIFKGFDEGATQIIKSFGVSA